MKNRFVVVVLSAVGVSACGPTFPFHPSNLPTTFAFPAAPPALLFGAGTCGPRAELDTDTGAVRCFDSGGGAMTPSFTAVFNSGVVQSDTTELMVFLGTRIQIDVGTEVQLRGTRPAVLVALQDIVVAGKITAQNTIAQYTGEGGGFSTPVGAGPQQGLGGGGGFAVTGAGAGGASHCGTGGAGGDATGTPITGGAGGPAYGTAAIVPIRGGSSGGATDAASGAGGGAIQLVAGTTLNVTVDGSIHMGGLGGGGFGHGGGSGGAVLLEAPTVTVAGKLGANGGGGGGGSGVSAGLGENATVNAVAALGGAAGVGLASAGGNGSAGTNLNGSNAAAAGDQPGGGGGGAGWIRVNSQSGTASITGAVTPALTTSCATQGTITPL